MPRFAGGPAILEFTAEEDMTWMDFNSSNFNDGRFSTYEIPDIKTTIQFKTEIGYWTVVDSEQSVNIFDKILDDYTYDIT